MKIHLCIALICLNVGIASAQEIKRLFIGIEAGISTSSGEIENMDYMRSEVSRYYDGYPGIDLGNFVSRRFIGIKAEKFTTSNKFGFLTGIRLTRMSSTIGQNDFSTSDGNYFYFLFQEDGLNTEYLRVSEINQISNYVGIPLEVRFFPFKPRLVRFYFKLGAEGNYLFKTTTDVTFFNNAMDQFEDELVSKFEQPRTFTYALYSGGGIRIGSESRPIFSIEGNLPYLALTPESNGLVDPLFGFGIQFNLQIPIKTKEK
jgi:hypothetical protein